MARSRGRVERARGSTSQPHSRDGDGVAGSGERVRSEASQAEQASAQSSARSQGRASCPPKASWVRRAVASNRVAVSKGPGSTGQLYSLTKDRSYRANARRSPRGSARRATEDVRRRAVGFGSLSRRTQRVTSRRERKRPTGLTSCSRARSGTMAEAAAAKNRGTGGRERQRELHAPPRSGIDTDRRCRAVGWPPLRGGFARPTRKEG